MDRDHAAENDDDDDAGGNGDRDGSDGAGDGGPVMVLAGAVKTLCGECRKTALRS